MLVLTLAMFGPLLRPGTLLLLDFSQSVGPHVRLSPATWGFPPDLQSGVPVNAVLVGLFRLLDRGPVRLLPLLVVPALAAWGFARLFGGRPIPALSATLLYVVNPFVNDRVLGGQVPFVLGYALLPLLISVLFSPADGVRSQGIGAGMLFSLAIALSPHFLFVAGLGPAAAAGTGVALRDRRLWGRALLASSTAAALSLYWIIPGVSAVGQLGRVTRADLSLFRTLGDPRFGLYPNVAGLYGFWHREWPLTKGILLGWPVFLLAILSIAVIGWMALWRGGRQRGLAVGLALGGAAAYLLALGDRGPTGGLFLWAFDHVPEFRIMREPQKFLAVVALAYAALFGLGVSSLVGDVAHRRGKALLLATLLLLPAVYSFRQLWGFWGEARPSTYPVSWTSADRLMGDGSGKILDLPWHLYSAVPFAQGRTLADPSPSFFRREVVFSENPEFGGLPPRVTSGRSRYLQFILREGPRAARFGNLIAPLGIEFVLLHRTPDGASYGWLYRQGDLRIIGRWGDLTLFRNAEPVSEVYTAARAVHLADWGAVVAFAEGHRLTDYVIRVTRAGPGPVPAPGPAPPGRPAGAAPLRVTGRSPVSVDVRGEAGGTLLFVEPFDPRWRLGGMPAAPSFGVTNSFRYRGEVREAIGYARWSVVRMGYAASALVLGLLLVALHRWRPGAGSGSGEGGSAP